MNFVLTPLLKNLHFMHPEWFLLLLAIPLLWAGWRWQRNHQGMWERLVDKPLMPFVLSGRDGALGLLPVLVLSLTLLLAVVAMAGPAWEKREVPVFRNQQALVVAMDFSLSMYAVDEKPNRLTLARFKLLDILKARQDGQTGLVVFAGDAFMVSPLTDDVATIEAQAKNLTPEIMPAQGSLVAPAVQRSVALLKQAGAAKGHILLMTDGANDVGEALAAVREAAGAGYTVSVLAIGSADGAPITQPHGGILRDGAGQTVVPSVDLAALRALAKAGDGVFAHAALGDADLAALSAQWQATLDDSVTQGEGRQVGTWLNQGYWLVLLLLPLAALAFRRGWLAAVLVCFTLAQPEPVYALDWKSWWQTPDQQGQQALQRGQVAEAAQLFQDREWKAAAAYKNQDYATAATQYQQSQTLDGQYNYANALAQQGKLADAVAAYDHVLKIDPNHDDARYNRDLVKKQLAQQKQQQQQSPPSAGNESEQKPQSGQPQQQQGQQAGGASNPQQKAAEEQVKKAQEQQDAAQQKRQQPQSGQEKKPQSEPSTPEEMSPQEREKTQAAEQWLQRIPDDPAGLWRRKFQYQYQQRGTQAKGEAW